MFAIFFLASILRIVLMLVNRQANDNHIEVVQRMLAGLPAEKDQCWECFQPKFYHGTVAFFAHLFALDSTTSIILLGEAVNVIAGIASLALIWKFLNSLSVRPKVKLFCFGLIALNPIFIGINAQATNDSFIIFLGIFTLFLLFRFFSQSTLFTTIILILSVNLSLLTKGNGLVIVLSVMVFLLFQILGAKAKTKSIKPYLYTLIAVCVTIAISTVWLSPYYTYYQKYHNPFVINWQKPPPPHLLRPTYSALYRPGIITVADGFFTFRFINLLMHPYTTHELTTFSLQRTSFWSQLYGNSQSVFFPQTPPSWENLSLSVITRLRLILILALLPTLFLLTGFYIMCVKIVKNFLRYKWQAFFNNFDLILVTYFIFFLLMLIDYVYTWRDFAEMKAIFIYPAFLSIAALLAKGMEFYFIKIKQPFIKKTGFILLILLLGFYFWDVMTLISQLHMSE